ncbi:MAG: hypothetical protein GF335_01745 [Candidatus Moranbacteria bacterium]|nr:hypothetical protein [Candidatus Moranbacteria bacterium]
MTYRKFFLLIFFKLLILIIIIAIPLMAVGFSSFLVVKTYNVSRSISKNDYLANVKSEFQNKNYQKKNGAEQLFSQTMQIIGEEKPQLKYGGQERVNVLLLGKASQDYPGSQLTDTIILASYNPSTNQSAMLSIPRDLYVKIPDSRQYTKLNFIYHYGTQRGGERGGIKYMNRVIKRITGQQAHYFILIDFKGFEKLIDEIGGIDVNVKKDIVDKKYPGPNYSYQTFEIEQGWQHLDGAGALKYVRTRHNPQGDFGRASRQQQVLAAIKNKFFSIRGIPLLTKLNSILDIVSQNVQTDINIDEYGSFLAIAKNINVKNTVNKVIDNKGQNPILINYTPFIQGRRAYFLKAPNNDYTKIHELAENIFDLDKLRLLNEKRKLEKPTVEIINTSNNSKLSQKLKNKLDKTSIKIINQTNPAADPYVRTQVYDNTQGLKPYSLNTVLNIFDSPLAKTPYPNSKADFVIVLGSDSEELLQEEEVILPEEALQEYE